MLQFMFVRNIKTESFLKFSNISVIFINKLFSNYLFFKYFKNKVQGSSSTKNNFSMMMKKSQNFTKMKLMNIDEMTLFIP